MIRRTSTSKNPSKSHGQRTVRALAWLLARKLAIFGFTIVYLLLDLALVEVEVLV